MPLNDSYKHSESRLSIFEKASRTLLPTWELWNIQWLHCCTEGLPESLGWDSWNLKYTHWNGSVMSEVEYLPPAVFHLFHREKSTEEFHKQFYFLFEFSIAFPVQPFYQTHSSLLKEFTALFQMLHLSPGFCWMLYLFFRKHLIWDTKQLS